MIFLELFWEFFKIGLFAIGGGVATLPFLYNLAQTHPHWITQQTIADMVAISESTPGPIGINMATYSGFQVAGILGGIIATLAEVAPSIIIIVIIARFLGRFDKNQYVQDAFYGLRAVVVGLITFAGLGLLISVVYANQTIHWVESIVFIIMFVLVMIFKRIHPLIWILSGAVLGIILGLPS